MAIGQLEANADLSVSKRGLNLVTFFGEIGGKYVQKRNVTISYKYLRFNTISNNPKTTGAHESELSSGKLGIDKAIMTRFF